MRYKPKLDNFDLELIGGIDTALEKSIVEYEVPFANGAILDDMGTKGRKFQIRTIWRRGNYEAHRDFIDYAEAERLNTFIHPELGQILGRIKSVNVIHDARRQCAEISLEFLEDKNPDVAPAYNPSLEASLEEVFNKSAAALVDTMAADLLASDLDPTAELTDSGQPLAGQVQARTFAARTMLAKMDRGVTALRGAVNAVLNPAESAVGVFDWGMRLPGVIVGTAASAVERAAMLAAGAGNSPVMFAATLRDNIDRLVRAVPELGNNLRVLTANIGALFAGKMFEKDESGKAVMRRIEDAPQWKPDGTSIKAPPAPKVLTENELDESLARICGMIDEGTDAAMSSGCVEAVSQLTHAAAELTRYINAIKLERDRVTAAEVEDDTPLHLVCLRYGLPYMYADRIVTINGDMWNPTFCRGEVKVYERRG